MDFETYATQSRQRLLRLAVVLTDDPELAQDVVQDVLLKAQQRWPTIGALDQSHAYVRRMIVNEVVSWRRKWGRIEARPDERLDRQVPDQTDAIDSRDAILRELALLPARQRAAVVMRYFEDMSDVEIAAVLDCRPATARGLLHRALKALRVDLESRAVAEAHR
ncbi:MAG: SigE family RNA polymerase sigma factor [Jatrophihabitans sp.]